MLLQRFFIIATLGFGLATCSSKKDDPTPTALPSITQNGANTFGCLVNGELMVAVNKCEGYMCTTNPFYDPSFGFIVGASMDSTRNRSKFFVSIQLDSKFQEGDYLLDTMKNQQNSTLIRCGLRVHKNFSNSFACTNRDSGTFYQGHLKISKWVKGQNGFVSGTFWFDLYNPAQYPDTVRVREGRFDIPYN